MPRGHIRKKLSGSEEVMVELPGTRVAERGASTPRRSGGQRRKLISGLPNLSSGSGRIASPGQPALPSASGSSSGTGVTSPPIPGRVPRPHISRRYTTTWFPPWGQYRSPSLNPGTSRSIMPMPSRMVSWTVPGASQGPASFITTGLFPRPSSTPSRLATCPETWPISSPRLVRSGR